jgi:hypothetical protein
MPFQRRWSEVERDFVVDRDLTGPPRPAPSTGTVKAEDGSIVADSSTISIPPATPVNVTLPSPLEPVIGQDGMITHRWWRFLNELYLRTGGVQDNINRVPTSLLGVGSPALLTIVGAAPSAEISVTEVPGSGSLTLSGIAPSAFTQHNPPSAGLSIASEAPTIV